MDSASLRFEAELIVCGVKPHIWNPEGQSLSNRRIRGSLNGKGPRDCPAANGGSHARTQGPLRVHEAWRDSSAEPLRTQRCPRAADARSPPPSSSCGWRGSQPRLVVLAPMLWGCHGLSGEQRDPPVPSPTVLCRGLCTPFRSPISVWQKEQRFGRTPGRFTGQPSRSFHPSEQQGSEKTIFSSRDH